MFLFCYFPFKPSLSSGQNVDITIFIGVSFVLQMQMDWWVMPWKDDSPVLWHVFVKHLKTLHHSEVMILRGAGKYDISYTRLAPEAVDLLLGDPWLVLKVQWKVLREWKKYCTIIIRFQKYFPVWPFRDSWYNFVQMTYIYMKLTKWTSVWFKSGNTEMLAYW